MTQRRPVPLGKKAAADPDTFVQTGNATPAAAADPAADPEIAKTFRIPALLSKRLKIYAAHTGLKEKDILAAALIDHLDQAGA